MENKHFNLRAYGLWINTKEELFVTDEYFLNKYMTKFPGGGLEFGEGLIDCVKREWMEELNVEINIKEHFYTTDFFQTSVFNPESQIISVYYIIEPINTPDIEIKSKPFDFENVYDGVQTFRFIPIKEITEEQFTLPIDKKVAMLVKKYIL